MIQAPAAIFHSLKLGQVVISTIALDNLLTTKCREAYLPAKNSDGTVIMVGDLFLFQSDDVIALGRCILSVLSLPSK